MKEVIEIYFKMKRTSLQSDPDFVKKLKKLTGKILSENGEEVSLREVTSQMIKVPSFDETLKQTEESLTDKIKRKNSGFKVKFDGRIL